MIRTPGSPEDSFAFTNINYDPATAVVVGTAVNVGGNILGGEAAMQGGEYTDAMYKRNAGIYDSKADLALKIGERNVSIFDDAFESQMASTEAALLNSGVRMEGTALELIQHSYGQAEIERQNIMYDANVASYDFKEAAVGEISKGNMALFQARQQRASAWISSIGTIVGTAGQIGYMNKAAANTKLMIDAQAANNNMLTDMMTTNTLSLTDLNNTLEKNLFKTSIENSLKALNDPLGLSEHGNLLKDAE